MRDPIDDLLHRDAIARRIQGWAHWRDTCDWASLQDCFVPDATMVTTWFDGSAADFVAASRRLAETGAGGSVQHVMGASIVELGDGRAIAATRVQLAVRGKVHGVAVDVVCLGRFHDRLLLCPDGAWRLRHRIPVYDKDMLQPVVPGTPLHLDAEVFGRLPPHYAHLSYMQQQGGATITMDLPVPNSAEDRALRAADAAWLAGRD